MASQPPNCVLIVDDDPAKRHAVAKILRRAGYATVEGETGGDALRLAADKPILIILDVKLPDMSGFEACRRLKEDPGTAAIPVLHISTTFVDIEDRIHGLEGGADGYLTDVLEPLELIATVRALIRARKAEEAAQISTRQWQVTFDAVSDGVILLDRDGRIVQINASMEVILGKLWNDLSGRGIHELLPVRPLPEDSPFLRMLESGQREAAELTLDGRWIRLTVDPIRDQGGVKGGLCIASDITDRRRMEEELRSRAEELAAADRRKDEFLAMLAHELRNPLAPIANALEAIRLGRGDSEGMAESLHIADRQVRHMARMLDDLLDVSRFTRGNIQLREASVELASILDQALEIAIPLIESAGHELSTSYPAESVWLVGDPTRLAQVVANLLNNAAKYTDRGGRIALSACREGDEAVVRVRDNGIGLGPEMLHRVFDLFAQDDRSLDRSQGGLGIGLTLVRSLVQLHGGEVGVHSGGPGQGSEFMVRLPAALPARSPEDRPEAVPVTATPRGRCRRLLVVDDSLDSARSLARVLKLWEFEVEVAHDGPGAIERASTGSFDVILLDIGLPGMDGYQVAERLRHQFGGGGPVLIALTGYGQEEDMARSRRVGFDDHLVKPVSLDRLRSLLSDPVLLDGRGGLGGSTSGAISG